MSTLGLEPEPSSHDWHVQPSCQRPNRFPPERRAFSPERKGSFARARRPRLHRIRLSSKPIQATRSPARCQPIVPTGFPPVFHNPGTSTDPRRDSRPRLSSRAKLDPWSCGATGVLARPPLTLRATERIFRHSKPCPFGTSRGGRLFTW